MGQGTDMHIAVLKDIGSIFLGRGQDSCSPSRFNFSLPVKVNPCSTQQNNSFQAGRLQKWLPGKPVMEGT
jgi:hypothetical protein